MNHEPFLTPNRYVDSDHPDLVAFGHEAGGEGTDREVAVRLYYRVRDMLRYNPWRVSLDRSGYRASEVLLRDPTEGGHCIDKALLLAGAARARGIPSRLHFANVRNHVGTAALEERLGTDLLVFHGYTELWLQGRWVAATPAFNLELCEHLGVEALEFDGIHDSIFQAYDRQAGRFMEYVDDHGSHAGIPFDDMIAAWRTHYSLTSVGQWPQRPAKTA